MGQGRAGVEPATSGHLGDCAAPRLSPAGALPSELPPLPKPIIPQGDTRMSMDVLIVVFVVIAAVLVVMALTGRR